MEINKTRHSLKTLRYDKWYPDISPPWTTASPQTIVLNEIPLRTITHGFFSAGQWPLNNSPWTTTPRQLPPIKFSSRTITHPDFIPLDNYPWIVSPWPVTLMKFPTGQFSPELLPLELFSLNNSSLNNYPQTTDPAWNSSWNKWQRTFALKNYPK